MRNFQDILESRKRSFIIVFSISMAVPLNIALQKLVFYRQSRHNTLDSRL